jgi:hypothetical protein
MKRAFVQSWPHSALTDARPTLAEVVYNRLRQDIVWASSHRMLHCVPMTCAPVMTSASARCARRCPGSWLSGSLTSIRGAQESKRASHIDPPASSYAIRRACPYHGENNGPGKDVHGELDPTPGIGERPRPRTDMRRAAVSGSARSPPFRRRLASAISSARWQPRSRDERRG